MQTKMRTMKYETNLEKLTMMPTAYVCQAAALLVFALVTFSTDSIFFL